MRQTLLRILLDETWAFEVQGGIPMIGLGYLLVPWLLFCLWWVLRNAQALRDRPKELRANIVFGLAVAVAFFALPSLLAGRVPANGVPVYGYGAMLFLGFLAAGLTAARRATRVGLEKDAVWDIGMWIFFAGIAGARLFYVVQYHERVFAGKHGLELLLAAVNLPDGGLVLYGGIIVAIITYFMLCHVKRQNPLLLADVIVPSFFLGEAFGRVGCLLNGCCFGDRCDLPWAVTFPHDSVPFLALVNRGFLSADAVATLPLHPTQIYSSLSALVLSLLTAVYFKHRPRDGAVLALGLLGYPIMRFVLEFLRGDELGQLGTSLTISQWVSVGVFSAGLVYAAWLAPAEKPTIPDQ